MKAGLLGLHWMGQATGCSARALGDVDVARGLLDALVATLGLTAVAPVQVRLGASGVVAVVLLAESHASVHTDVQRGWAYVDVFCCRGFDAQGAAALVAQAYGASSVQEQLLPRGPVTP